MSLQHADSCTNCSPQVTCASIILTDGCGGGPGICQHLLCKIQSLLHDKHRSHLTRRQAPHKCSTPCPHGRQGKNDHVPRQTSASTAVTRTEMPLCFSCYPSTAASSSAHKLPYPCLASTNTLEPGVLHMHDCATTKPAWCSPTTIYAHEFPFHTHTNASGGAHELQCAPPSLCSLCLVTTFFKIEDDCQSMAQTCVPTWGIQGHLQTPLHAEMDHLRSLSYPLHKPQHSVAPLS